MDWSQLLVLLGPITAAVLGIGVVMLVTPGPAVVFIPLGLAILAIEFAWARRLLKRVREQFPDRAGKGPAETEASKDRADAARRQPGQDHETQESSASRAPTRS